MTATAALLPLEATIEWQLPPGPEDWPCMRPDTFQRISVPPETDRSGSRLSRSADRARYRWPATLSHPTTCTLRRSREVCTSDEGIYWSVASLPLG